MLNPSGDEIERGTAALVPFVQAWRLSLNPEDLEVMVDAVIQAVRSGASLDEIVEASRNLIAEHAAAAQTLREAMQEALDVRDHGQQKGEST